MPRSVSTLKTLAELEPRLRNQAVHIRALRFPYYRNIAPNEKLTFAFPITAILGRNGTNKSSILQALYGAPRGNSVAEYWFETELDAIPEKNAQGLKQSVVHTYRNKDGRVVDCIKARAPRGEEDPDYWEAVKPTVRYGFSSESQRISPIELNVVYLDFRGQLPAFDKYFYFPDERHLQRRIAYAKRKGILRRDYRKQDYLRQRTRPLRDLLDSSGSQFPNSELEILSYVMDRTYTSGVMVEHSLFHGHGGHTILFHTEQLEQSYSEAFAGSGESAAAMLIHRIETVEKGSLVLLDEPETSLHPTAQQRILQYLSNRAATKSLQVVIATHSPCFAEGLPPEAIRVLRANKDGKP